MTVLGPAAVLWMRRHVEVHLAALGRLAGGAVSHWTLSHFRLRDCQCDAFLDISEQPAGLKSVRVLLRARAFLCASDHRYLTPTASPSSSASSAPQATMFPSSSTCGSLGAFFLFKMPFMRSTRELPPLNTAEGKQNARQRWWSLQTSHFIRPGAHYCRGVLLCLCQEEEEEEDGRW